MPAQPLTADQKADAKRLSLLFSKWQNKQRNAGQPASQTEFAEKLGLDFGQSAMSQYLRGAIPLNVKTVVRCAAVLGCTVEDISPALANELHNLGAAAFDQIDEHNLPVRDSLKKSHIPGMFSESVPPDSAKVEPLTRHIGDSTNFRRVYVVGKAQGGLPERIWTDGDHLVGAIDEYAELATPDPKAFIYPVPGDSMYPRFMPGEYVLVEPNTPPQIGGTVLVRLVTGETMLKRLEYRANGHVRLVSWNDPVQYTFREEDLSWMYYVAHSVPPEKIKIRF